MQEGDGVQSEPGRDPEGRAGRGKLLPAMQTQIQIFLSGSNFPAMQLQIQIYLQARLPIQLARAKVSGVGIFLQTVLPATQFMEFVAKGKRA